METQIPDAVQIDTNSAAAQHEAAALKMMAQFFADELIPY